MADNERPVVRSITEARSYVDVSTGDDELSGTLTTLLKAVTEPNCSAGQIATVLRSYTTGFVIDEQAFLELEATGEWDALVGQVAEAGHRRTADTDDLIAILTDDRNQRFATGLDMILTGLVRSDPAPRP